jgi:hypothetical protein
MFFIGLSSNLQDLKPNWLPKADIPSSVPKLPTEYVHRHRLMKQVVSCLLDQSGAGPRDTDDEAMVSYFDIVALCAVPRDLLGIDHH